MGKELRNKAKCNELMFSSTFPVSAFPILLASDCLNDCLIVTRISEDRTLRATDIVHKPKEANRRTTNGAEECEDIEEATGKGPVCTSLPCCVQQKQ